MKKIFLFLLLSSSCSLFAQDDVTTIKNSVRVNSIGLFTGYYEFQYERVINEKSAVRVGFGTGTLLNNTGSDADDDFMEAFGTNSFNNENEHTVDGFSINADYRYFFSSKGAPEGVYVSPGVQYLKLNEKYTYVNTNEGGFRTLVDNDYSIFSIRAMVGYQFILAKSIVINPYLGAGIGIGTVETPTARVDGYGSGAILSLGLDLGIGF
jgi:hypothetical protein|tara:strand:+ start:26398 stop:27024 length:627 start_codon:yes stop_codon:yes gene_type:complete